MHSWELQTKDRSNEQEALRYLLQSTEILGLLNSNRLIGGFEAFELRLIFNQVAEWLQKETRAYHLEKTRKKSLLDACKSVFDAGGEVVISEKDGGHWILATGSTSAGLSVLDSDPSVDADIRKSSSMMAKVHGLALLCRGISLAQEFETNAD
jgi:hypothetical protein